MHRWLIVAVSLLVVSCGGGDSRDAAPSAESTAEVTGRELFNQRVVGSNPGCVTCHSLEEGVTLVGPSMAGLAVRAGTTVPGLSAADYIRLSITEPDSFVVDGFVEGQMPSGWDQTLTERQIDSLVAFLLGN